MLSAAAMSSVCVVYAVMVSSCLLYRWEGLTFWKGQVWMLFIPCYNVFEGSYAGYWLETGDELGNG